MLIYHLSGSHMREPLFSVSGALFGTSLRKNPNNDNNERNFNQPFQRLLGYTSAGQHVTGNRLVDDKKIKFYCQAFNYQQIIFAKVLKNQ